MSSTTFGTFFELGSRGAMEALCHTGLDYVIIDTEHGFLSVESTADLILAAERGSLLPYVRIGDIRRPYVLRMLDIGARGLIVPNIHSADEVRELVQYAKFQPLGNRGYCPTRTSGWGADAWAQNYISYTETCNQQVKLIPQCETREALEQVEEIASIPGVDGIFVGPCDLSIALDIPLQFEHPLLLSACERILAACRKNKIEALIFAGSMHDALRWVRKGFDSIAYSLDASVLIQSYRSLIQEFRNAAE